MYKLISKSLISTPYWETCLSHFYGKKEAGSKIIWYFYVYLILRDCTVILGSMTFSDFWYAGQ